MMALEFSAITAKWGGQAAEAEAVTAMAIGGVEEYMAFGSQCEGFSAVHGVLSC